MKATHYMIIVLSVVLVVVSLRLVSTSKGYVSALEDHKTTLVKHNDLLTTHKECEVKFNDKLRDHVVSLQKQSELYKELNFMAGALSGCVDLATSLTLELHNAESLDDLKRLLGMGWEMTDGHVVKEPKI